MEVNSATRFSERAKNYSLYRPGYPPEIISYLTEKIGLEKSVRIADIGSGTGIFASLFLEAGYQVTAIEPNAEMRRISIKSLNRFNGFNALDATAERTTLRDHSIGLITVAQAFHWFDNDRVKAEFTRILTTDGHILLTWNIMRRDTPLMRDYAAIKAKYDEKIDHSIRANLEKIQALFDPLPVVSQRFEEVQWLDAEGLKGHLSSFSSVPLPSSAQYSPMMKEIDRFCDHYAENGLLKLEYETMLYLV